MKLPAQTRWALISTLRPVTATLMALKPALVRCDAAGWPRDATPASAYRRGDARTYFGGAYVEGLGGSSFATLLWRSLALYLMLCRWG